MTTLNATSVLIVDDEAHIRTYLAKELERIGLSTIVQARNGLEAIRMYREEHPDVILLDINMPEMNGEDVLQTIREEDDSVTIVMITAMISQHSIERCADMGADHFLSKGAAPKELRAELEKIFIPQPMH
jgi:CheY-like chemotaxis protein